MRAFSTDHKVIGLRYGVTSLAFLLVGFLLILIVRWHLAWPEAPIPLLGWILGDSQVRDGVVTPEFYPQLTAMHGTIMVFLGVVPLAVGAFATYLVPLMIGASDTAFPRLSSTSYWLYVAGGVVMLAGFILPGGAAGAGWTSYPPLATFATSGQTAWLVGLVLVGLSSVLLSATLIVTILQLRAPGLSMMQLPFFVWSQLVTSFLLLLAFPPLIAACLLQLMDRLAGTSFFLPSGLVLSGQAVGGAGGGSPLLWQHLFWFLAHPEVYVLILPALGIVAAVIPTATRRPLWGYPGMVGASLFMGVMSFLVWAHHMFLTGMGPTMSTFFQVTTMIISVPSVIIVSALLLSLHGGSIRFTVPALFAFAFLPMFGIGGLTGLPLGLAASDIALHDTNYVVGHFHYVVAPGTLFALFAGIYFWYPRVTGRQLDTRLGHVHFWGSLIAMNGIFLPMLIQGLAGLNRRLYDGGRSYTTFAGFDTSFAIQAWAAVLLGVAQIPFVVNLLRTRRQLADVEANPWGAATLEWTSPHQPDPPPSLPHAVTPRYDTGVSNIAMGTWLLLAALLMLLGAVFSSYAMLRVAASTWPAAGEAVRVGYGGGVLACVCAATALAWRASARAAAARRPLISASGLLATAAMVLVAAEWRLLLSAGVAPSTSTFFALYFTITGLLACLVAGGTVAAAWLAIAARRLPDAHTRERARALARYWTLVTAAFAVSFVGQHLT